MRAADSVVSLYPLLLLLLFRALWDCGYTKQIYCLSGLVRCSTICKTTTQNKKNLSCNKSINLTAALHMRLLSDTHKLKKWPFPYLAEEVERKYSYLGSAPPAAHCAPHGCPGHQKNDRNIYLGCRNANNHPFLNTHTFDHASTFNGPAAQQERVASILPTKNLAQQTYCKVQERPCHPKCGC